MSSPFASLWSDDSALSPVVGVVLMIAITLILAATVGTFLLQISTDATTRGPVATFSVAFTDDGSKAIVRHERGESVDAGDIYIVGAVPGGEVAWTNVSSLEAGDQVWSLNTTDSITVDETEGDAIQVVWRGSGHSTPVSREYPVPTTDDDETGPSDPLGLAIYDSSSSTENTAVYTIDYDVSAIDGANSVRLRFEDTTNSWASQTYTRSDLRTRVSDYSEGGVYGDDFSITLEVLDAEGAVVASESVTDPADGTDPGGNDNLSTVNSPTVGSFSLHDTSSVGEDYAEFAASYSLNTDGSFGGTVDVEFKDRTNSWGTKTNHSTKATDTLDYYDTGTATDQYTVSVLVYDADGVLVDMENIDDTADGVDP